MGKQSQAYATGKLALLPVLLPAFCKPSLLLHVTITQANSAQGCAVDDSMPVADLQIGANEFLVRQRHLPAFAYTAVPRSSAAV